DKRLPSGSGARILQAEAWVGEALDNGDEQRHVLRPAAGHERVDRPAPDGCLSMGGRQDRDHLIRRAAGEADELADAPPSWRHHWQAVAPHPLEENVLDGIEG